VRNWDRQKSPSIFNPVAAEKLLLVAAEKFFLQILQSEGFGPKETLNTAR
jgi:hypothetical protein